MSFLPILLCQLNTAEQVSSMLTVPTQVQDKMLVKPHTKIFFRCNS